MPHDNDHERDILEFTSSIREERALMSAHEMLAASGIDMALRMIRRLKRERDEALLDRESMETMLHDWVQVAEDCTRAAQQHMADRDEARRIARQLLRERDEAIELGARAMHDGTKLMAERDDYRMRMSLATFGRDWWRSECNSWRTIARRALAWCERFKRQRDDAIALSLRAIREDAEAVVDRDRYRAMWGAALEAQDRLTAERDALHEERDRLRELEDAATQAAQRALEDNRRLSAELEALRESWPRPGDKRLFAELPLGTWFRWEGDLYQKTARKEYRCGGFGMGLIRRGTFGLCTTVEVAEGPF